MQARDVFRLTGAVALFAIAALLLPGGAAAAPPSLTIDSPGTPSIATVPVSGTVDAHGIATQWTFEVSTDGVSWSPTNVSGFTEANGAEPVSGVVEGLTAETGYEVRLAAFNFEEFVNYATGLTPSFTTEPAPNVPGLALDPASALTYTGAHLSGSIDPEEGNVDANAGLLPIGWELQYAPASEPGSWQTASATSENPLTGSNAEGTSAVAVEAEVGGLKAGTEYAYRLLAHYAGLTTATPEAGYGHFTTTVAAKPNVSGLAASETHFSGLVNPGAPGPAPQDPIFETHWEFTCNPGCSFEGPSSGTLEASDATEEVTATPTGLTPNQSYDVTLHATNGAGEESETLLAAFTTPGLKPDIERETLWEPTATSIQLNARVNPHNSPLSDCHFEYGVAGGPLSQSVSCENPIPTEAYAAPASEAVTIVAARISGLEPATEYEFRLVATNGSGTSDGDPRSFTSLEEETPQSCPNEAKREEQHATDLADCRAYEKVSPAEKGNGDIVGDGGTNIAAADGNAVTLSTRTPFGDTIGSGVAGQTQYVARRSAEGWSTHAITPQPRADAYQTFFGSTRFEAYSDDLRTAVVWGYDFPDATGDLPLRNNIYVEDTATRALRPVTMFQNGLPDPLPHPIRELSSDADWGVSADAKHVAFVSRAQYLPAAASGMPNVYQWDDGVLSLAGVLPDGSVPPEGSEVVSQEDQPMTIYRQAMSADGSRQLFTASFTLEGQPQLFQRIHGDRTVWVSESELEPSVPAYQFEPVAVRLNAVTPDGKNIFFSTKTALVPGDTNETAELYRWTDSPDPAHELNLTRIGGAGRVIGVSADGNTVYLQSSGDAITVWTNGTTHQISGGVATPGTPAERLGIDNWGPGNGRVSADGRFLAFLTSTSNFGIGTVTGRVTNAHRELYLYDIAQDSIKCVSCPSGAAIGDATVVPEATDGVISYTVPGIRPNFLSHDGRIFFSTAEALVPQDTNGVLDAYEYDPTTGRLSLLSTGRGSDPTNFTDASASGDDVFLVTRQRVTHGDTDGLVDLYDARTGGGLPEPEPEVLKPCDGEGCQPASAPPPAGQEIGSARAAAGNVHKPRCAKNQVKVRRKGKVRCARKHHKRHAKHNGRASR